MSGTGAEKVNLLKTERSKMKNEQIGKIVLGVIVGHIILSFVSPKYRKFTEDAISGISILNLL